MLLHGSMLPCLLEACQAAPEHVLGLLSRGAHFLLLWKRWKRRDSPVNSSRPLWMTYGLLAAKGGIR